MSGQSCVRMYYPTIKLPLKGNQYDYSMLSMPSPASSRLHCLSDLENLDCQPSAFACALM